MIRSWVISCVYTGSFMTLKYFFIYFHIYVLIMSTSLDGAFVWEGGLDSDRCAHMCVVSILVRSHVWYDGHLVHLNQVDFDLSAHPYWCAQLTEYRNLLLPGFSCHLFRKHHRCSHMPCFTSSTRSASAAMVHALTSSTHNWTNLYNFFLQ